MKKNPLIRACVLVAVLTLAVAFMADAQPLREWDHRTAVLYEVEGGSFADGAVAIEHATRWLSDGLFGLRAGGGVSNAVKVREGERGDEGHTYRAWMAPLVCPLRSDDQVVCFGPRFSWGGYETEFSDGRTWEQETEIWGATVGWEASRAFAAWLTCSTWSDDSQAAFGDDPELVSCDVSAQWNTQAAGGLGFAITFGETQLEGGGNRESWSRLSLGISKQW